MYKQHLNQEHRRKMVSGAGSGSRVNGGGRGGSEEGAAKKGPWTAAEDAILMEYVRKHGEGNWNSVQRNSGLLRCGKSCRLRWANHLRPNLKKGSFSPEEERLIIQLHAKLGNKWARMASQLPGRTDNEIKNYWNTRVKRLQRAGLPVYPDDIPIQFDPPQPPYPNSSSNYKLNPSLALFDRFPQSKLANPFQPRSSSSFLSDPNDQYNFFHENFPSKSHVSPFSTSPSTIYIDSFEYSPLGLVPTAKTGLPSIQPPALGAATSDSSGSTGGDGGVGDSYMNGPPFEVDEYCDIAPEMGNSGLLDALLEESKALVEAEKMKVEISMNSGKCKGISESDSSSAHSSVGMKAKDPLEEMNPMDDDLSSLLNNFPLTVPVPDWYHEAANARSSNGESSKKNGVADSGFNTPPQDDFPSPVATTLKTSDPKWSTLGPSCWNNMPDIC
ncbi:hypothetical protein RHMOL_Rhmol04G0078800 [Rhododendron molle]|uniref:Uncharacterized protein n=1 Tax=Rhododendron molle TaxID=49168 RepID=A0ACC0NYC7_RHOML|nr:hypothetical protein RHMOL_Rhmol04G0078800 [Rhododendron molle]